MIQIHPHQCKSITDALQIEKKIPSTEIITAPIGAIDGCSVKQQHPMRTPARNAGGRLMRSLKRRAAATRAQSSYPHTISELADLLATGTDEQYTQIIHQLPEGWSTANDRGTRVTKRQLEMAHWGAYKDDHNALTFQQTIMHTRQYPNTVHAI
jgi:hypothetical protein